MVSGLKVGVMFPGIVPGIAAHNFFPSLPGLSLAVQIVAALHIPKIGNEHGAN